MNKPKIVLNKQFCTYEVGEEYSPIALDVIRQEIKNVVTTMEEFHDTYFNYDTVFRLSKMALEISRNHSTSLLDKQDIHILHRLDIKPFKTMPIISVVGLEHDDPLDPYIKVMRSVMVS
jgi:hypothetical protein